jgi:hypothetical protein
MRTKTIVMLDRETRQRRSMGKKQMLATAVTVLLVLLLGSEVQSARLGDFRLGAKSGYCPAGTCASNGGGFAGNVKNCKKENCRRR